MSRRRWEPRQGGWAQAERQRGRATLATPPVLPNLAPPWSLVVGAASGAVILVSPAGGAPIDAPPMSHPVRPDQRVLDCCALASPLPSRGGTGRLVDSLWVLGPGSPTHSCCFPDPHTPPPPLRGWFVGTMYSTVDESSVHPRLHAEPTLPPVALPASWARGSHACVRCPLLSRLASRSSEQLEPRGVSPGGRVVRDGFSHHRLVSQSSEASGHTQHHRRAHRGRRYASPESSPWDGMEAGRGG